jgi:hypothetical protein
MFEFAPYLKVFKDNELQQQFAKDGYVIVPFYNEEEVEYLNNLYHDLHPKDEKGFFPSTFSKDKEYRTKADDEIQKLGSRTMNEILEDVKVVCGSFIVKSPGADSIMPLHQDMTLVDESKYCGMNIWCPLIDLDDKNGVLNALKGSQRIHPSYRGSSIPNIYNNVQEEVIEYMKPIYLKAGEAIIFDQSIFHYSPPNLSDGVRIVTNTFFTHKDATFMTVWYDKDNHKGQVERFEQDDDFMTNFEQFGHDIYSRPRMGKSLGLIDYNFPFVTVKELEERYGKLPPKPQLIPQVVETTSYEKPKSKLRTWINRLFSSNN